MKKKKEYFFRHTASLLPCSKKFELFFTEEFCLNGTDRHCLIEASKVTPWKKSISHTIATFEKTVDFTIIMMFAPKTFLLNNHELKTFMETSEILFQNKVVKFSSLVTTDHPVTRIPHTENFDILIFITCKTRDVSKIETRPQGSLRIPNHQTPLKTIYEILKNTYHL